MVHIFDKFMVKAGFDAKDVAHARYRNMLYFGILIMSAICTVFLGILVF